MEFSIRTLVITMIAIIAFLILVALLTTWSSEGGNLLNNLYEFFRNILANPNLG